MPVWLFPELAWEFVMVSGNAAVSVNTGRALELIGPQGKPQLGKAVTWYVPGRLPNVNCVAAKPPDTGAVVGDNIPPIELGEEDT